MLKKFLVIVGGSFLIYFFGWLILSTAGINKLDIKSEDTLPSMFLPFSIIKRGDLFLDHYYKMLTSKYPHPDDKDYALGLTPFYLKKVDGRYLSAFPIMSAVLALPVYFFPVIFGAVESWINVILFSHIASALIVSISGWFMYILLRKNTQLSEKNIYTLTIIYLFGTVNFAMISQALWQHGVAQLFIIISLIYFYDLLKYLTAKSAFFFGLFAGLAVLSRPTAILPFGFLILYLLIINGKNLKKFIKPVLFIFLGTLVCVLFFIYYNNKFYGNISNQGYAGQLLTGWLSPFPQSFLGVWFSPSKGIFVFSPIFIFSFFGAWLSWKKRNNLNLVFFLIAILHTLVISFWKHWYGGWSFGYRMSSDIIPFLVLLLVPFLESDTFQKYKKVFFVLLGISILIELYGMVFYDGIWHSAYDLGYENTSWLWSFSDSEFAFDFRRVLVKLDLLERACPKCL